jgi:hypothetical protein
MYNSVSGSKKFIIPLSKLLRAEAVIAKKVENTFPTWAT